MKTKNTTDSLKSMGDCLMNVGAELMSAGANTGRIQLTIERISKMWGIKTELMITNRVLLITVFIPDTDQFITILKRTLPHAANFTVISGVSRMTWRAVEQKSTVEQINNDLIRLKAKPHYNRWVVLLFVSLAGVAFCRNLGGSPTDALVTFTATFAGLFVRQEAHKKKFNVYLTVLFAALTATMISGLYSKFYLQNTKEYIAHATSVLFLIPGIPLINSFSDLIDGNHLNGILRSVNGLIIAFSIALGFYVTWVIIGL